MDDRQQLAHDLGAIARRTGSFKLRSGTMATRYFDEYPFESEPALLARIAAPVLPVFTMSELG